MAAPAPLVPVVVPAAALGNPLFDEDPVYLPAGHSLVAATSTFIQWQPVAAAANAPPQQVAAPFFALLYAFGIRCKVSPLPADLTAARAVNPFTMRFQAACWRPGAPSQLRRSEPGGSCQRSWRAGRASKGHRPPDRGRPDA